MRKELVKAKCSTIDEEGKGILMHKGRRISIPYVLEGESGMFKVLQNRDVFFGSIVELDKKSDLRTEPPCPYYYDCGGCQLQHMTNEAQNQFKQGTVEKLLSSYGTVEPLIAMTDPYHYRQKSHTTYVMSRGAIISGIYGAKSHRVTAIDRCLIQTEVADAIALTIRNLLPSFKLLPYDEDSGQGFLRHVLIRTGYYSKEVMVVLVASSAVFPSKANFVKKLLSLHPEINTVVLNINKRKTSMVLGHEEQVLYGKGSIEDQLCGITFRLSPRSFYQINPPQTEILYNKAIEYAGLTGKERVLDAYCGIGTISLVASKKAKEVVGVELNQEAIQDAIANAKGNAVKNVRFMKGDAGDYMLQMAEKGEFFDVVILDPPRSGSDERFLSAVLSVKPSRVVYVSCNPVTLARDLKVLTKGGYKVEAIQPVDLFPQTYHVECVVKLVRTFSSQPQSKPETAKTKLSSSSQKPLPKAHQGTMAPDLKKPHKGRVAKMKRQG